MCVNSFTVTMTTNLTNYLTNCLTNGAIYSTLGWIRVFSLLHRLFRPRFGDTVYH